MPKTIAILEVSKKQDYIFKSNKLKDNARRSAEIAYVTSSAFFEKAVSKYGTDDHLYIPEQNFVYAGGGHTVLQFADHEQARKFVGIVTETAMRQYEGLEIFAKLMDVDRENTPPGEILKELSKRLEQKKSRRQDAFRYTAFGIEVRDEGDNDEEKEPGKSKAQQDDPELEKLQLQPPSGWKFPNKFEDLKYIPANSENAVEDDNFLAVIHIDGNAMGAKVDAIYQKETTDWEKCCESLRNFSQTIQKDFEDAFMEMLQEIMRYLPNDSYDTPLLPVRPVILAGDDVCFVSAGSIGLECARIFLEKLSKKQINGAPYSACAGVAIVHRKYPFHLAYDMAEELCSNAKKFGASIDEKSRISAMDWHIEFGQLKDTLEEIREDYITEDGNHLELRPVVVVNPTEHKADEIREYEYFKTMCQILQKERENIARSKMKEWRTALKQGELEAEYFLNDKKIKKLLYAGFDALYRTKSEKLEQFQKILNRESSALQKPFQKSAGEGHSIYFDAIEMMDHAVFFEETNTL